MSFTLTWFSFLWMFFFSYEIRLNKSNKYTQFKNTGLLRITNVRLIFFFFQTGTFDGAQVGVHGGVDGNGKPQGGASVGAGVGKYLSGDVHIEAGADGVKTGVSGEASVPGSGQSIKGSIDKNLNNGKLTASGTIDVGGGPGTCVEGSTDVNKFMDKGKHGFFLRNFC